MLFEKILKFLLRAFLFLLPWQTIWIFRESFLGGAKMEWWTEGVYATEILLWVIFFLFMGWYWREKKLRNLEIKKFSFSKDRIFAFSVLLFTVYCLLSTFWTYDRSIALQHSLHIIEAFLLFFLLLLGPLKKEEAIKWLVFGSVFPCILGIWQFLTQTTFASKWLGLALHPAWQAGTSVVASDTIGRWLRAYGTFSHPNVFGGYIVIVLLLSYHITQATKHKFHLVLCCLSFVFFAALFFTFSRSAWVAVALLLIYQITQTTKHKFYYGLCCLGFVFFVTLFFPIIQTRFTSPSVTEMRSTDERISEYGDAWNLFKKDPMLGVGVGNYTKALWESNKWRPAWKIQPVHNVWVLFVVEMGMVGVLLLLFVAVNFSRLMVQITRHNSFESCYLGRVSCVSPLTIYFLLSFFDHYLYSSYIGLMLSAVFFGLILRKSDSVINPQLIHH